MGKHNTASQLTLNFDEEQPVAKVFTKSKMPWIQVAENSPYFVTDTGEDWTPIGQNDAITWPEFTGVYRRKDFTAVETYFKLLSDHGVTCLRLMMEYCQVEHRYFEKPAGNFNPKMVQLWDDIFALAEKYGLRILLTPFDTFWMWIRWSHHPYKKTNGGPCNKRSQWLTDAGTRSLIKQRLAFATERWGASGALFAWDLWNEIHPAHGGDSVACFTEFVEDISSFLRETELRIHGRAHPQTVSVFGPVLQKHPEALDCTFRHPALDFASIHFYATGSIDNPRNTVDAAITTGRLTREALAHTENKRPFFDSEHGPIHAFKDKKKTLPEPFDDEYFRHMQWAHLASGGAGGGMRWPNRSPHSLTPGMRKAQAALSAFLPLINWKQFERKNLNAEIQVSTQVVTCFGCADRRQAVVWLLRTDTIKKDGTLNVNAEGIPVSFQVPGLQPGRFRISVWNTTTGKLVEEYETLKPGEDPLYIGVQGLVADLAFAINYTM